MTNKRTISALLALCLIMIASKSQDHGYDATKVPMVNTDLMVLSVASFKQINEQVKQSTHNSNCNK